MVPRQARLPCLVGERRVTEHSFPNAGKTLHVLMLCSRVQAPGISTRCASGGCYQQCYRELYCRTDNMGAKTEALVRRSLADTVLRLSRLQAGRFLLARPLFAVPSGEAALLQGAGKTFGQTRSGTGNTHALGQDLPRIRALDGGLSCCPQARLRTFPVSLGKRGKEGLQIEMRRQKRRVQVTLHRPNATSALVPTHRQRFLEIRTAAMTILGQFGALRGDFDQGAARARPRCVGGLLETSLVLAVPRCGQTGEARRGTKSFR